MAHSKKWRAVSSFVGALAAAATGVLANAVAAQHFVRWDWTTNKRYSLSPASHATLSSLHDTVDVWVLLGSAEPLAQNVKALLEAYVAETSKLRVHFVDPDRDALALDQVRKRFRIETGRTESGHVVTDAVMVVALGERHWFVTAQELSSAASPAEPTRIRPSEERALTGAIRNVLNVAKMRVCFTEGHGELSPLDDSDHGGAGALRGLLEKDNYEVRSVDLSSPQSARELDACEVAVVAGARVPFARDEAERLRTWALADKSVWIAAGPFVSSERSPSDSPSDLPIVPVGLERVLAPFGMAFDDTVVVERDAARVLAESEGFAFVAEPSPHSITAALVTSGARRDVPRVHVSFARSLHHAFESGAASAVELLSTSPSAWALERVGEAHVGDSKSEAGKLHATAEDRSGQEHRRLVAMAAERPKLDAHSNHGSRAVVTGTASMLSNVAMREEPAYRGAALFAQSAISWLAVRPQVLDVPERAAMGTAIRLTEEAASSIRRYALGWMPGAVVALAAGVAWTRRGKNRKATRGASTRRRQS